MSPLSILELCCIHSWADGEQYQSSSMADLLAGELGAPYAARWSTLRADNRVWSDEPTTQEFIRGVLHPVIAKDLYGSRFEELAEQVAKSLVWVSGGFLSLLDPLLLRC